MSMIFAKPLSLRGYATTSRPGVVGVPVTCVSEIMTLLIWFHRSHYRTFKAFYQQHVCQHLRDAFPGVVSYGRFVELMPSALIPLDAYLRSCPGSCTGISFIDSTPLAVCAAARKHQHRLFV